MSRCSSTRLRDWPVGWRVCFDVRVIDGILNGLGSAVAWCGGELRVIQTGYVRTYALAILVGAVILLLYVMLR